MYLRLLTAIALIICSQIAYSQVRLAGKVTDGENGSSVAGATIVNKATGNSVISDINGVFILSLPKGEKQVITISAVGFQTKEISDVVGNPEEQTSLNITLDKAIGSLAEVVVKTSAKK